MAHAKIVSSYFNVITRNAGLNYAGPSRKEHTAVNRERIGDDSTMGRHSRAARNTLESGGVPLKGFARSL